MHTARYLQRILALVLIAVASPWLVAQIQPVQDKEAMPEQTETAERRQYTFAWQFSEESGLAHAGVRAQDQAWNWTNLSPLNSQE